MAMKRIKMSQDVRVPMRHCCRHQWTSRRLSRIHRDSSSTFQFRCFSIYFCSVFVVYIVHQSKRLPSPIAIMPCCPAKVPSSLAVVLHPYFNITVKNLEDVLKPPMRLPKPFCTINYISSTPITVVVVIAPVSISISSWPTIIGGMTIAILWWRRGVSRISTIRARRRRWRSASKSTNAWWRRLPIGRGYWVGIVVVILRLVWVVPRRIMIVVA
jgi:hypothetical protein